MAKRGLGKGLGAFFGEEVNDAVDRLVGVIGVQRSHTQMSGFRELKSVFHRFAITNFAHENHIRGLTQRIL